MTSNPVDFAKVEILRKRMGLSTMDMAAALKVSRMTYYLWVRGSKPRKPQLDRANKVLRVLLEAYQGESWDETRSLPAAKRRDVLLQLVA